MRRVALLLGSFLVTFALLITGWSFVSGKPLFPAPTTQPTSAPTATPSATPEPVLTLPPTAAPVSGAPSSTPEPALTLPPLPSPSPAPFRTMPPSPAPLPSGSPGASLQFVIAGSDFAVSDVPEGAQLARNGDLAVMRTTTNSADVLWLTYRVDPAQLAGVTIQSVDALICGRGQGQFWEVYGPTGSNPVEYEVVPPSADGCWHFADAVTDDVSVIAAVMLESQLIIERVEFTVHTAQ